jgi:hypothetical protein
MKHTTEMNWTKSEIRNLGITQYLSLAVGIVREELRISNLKKKTIHTLRGLDKTGFWLVHQAIMFNRDSTRKIVTALEMVMVLVSSLVFNGALQQQKNLVRSLTPILHLTREGESWEKEEREEDGVREKRTGINLLFLMNGLSA